MASHDWEMLKTNNSVPDLAACVTCSFWSPCSLVGLSVALQLCHFRANTDMQEHPSGMKDLGWRHFTGTHEQHPLFLGQLPSMPEPLRAREVPCRPGVKLTQTPQKKDGANPLWYPTHDQPCPHYMVIDWANLYCFVRLILILSSSFNPGGCPHVLPYICDFETPTDSKISGLFGDILIWATSHIICVVTILNQILAIFIWRIRC